MRKVVKVNSNFKVIKDEKIYDMKECGIIVNSFVIGSPSFIHHRENHTGNGFIDMGTRLDGRTMRATCTIKAVDNYDYEHLRNEVFRIFDSRKAFYIVRDVEPAKRWLVKVNNTYTINKLNSRIGQFEIEFISQSAYSESIGTTLDNKLFDVAKWQVGQNLIVNPTNYVHDTNTFSIYNASDVAIDPREHEIRIEYKGTSNNLTIKNNTTGDIWTYSGNSTQADTITLEGVKSLKNNNSIFRDTNKKLITLDTGWNNFEILGTSGSFIITFNFRFYYL